MMRLAVCSILLIFSSFVCAKNLHIKVLDTQTKHPICATKVYKADAEFLGSTDQAGELLIDAGKQAEMQLTLFTPNYQTRKIAISAMGGETQVIDLTPLSVELNEVVLKAKRQDFSLGRLKAVEGTSIFAGKKSEVISLDLALANKATNNPRQIFAKISGLNIYESNDGGLQLNIGGRGLDPNRTANFNTRQNNYDISADVLGYPESYYTPPSEALYKIEVIRGAASLQYGTQFGGLVNFKLRPPAEKPVSLRFRNTTGSYGLYSNYTELSGTVGKFSYQFAYNGKLGDGFRENSQYKAHFGLARLRYAFSTETSIGLEATYFQYLAKQPGGLSDVQFLENPLQTFRTRNWFQVDWKLLALDFKHQFSDFTNFSLIVSGLQASRKAIGFRGIPGAFNPQLFDPKSDQKDEFGNFIYPRDLIVGNFRNLSAEGKWLTRYKLNGNFAIGMLGVKYYQGANSSQQGAGSKGDDADFNFYNQVHTQYANQNTFDFPNRNLALFGEHIFYVTPSFSLTPGLRYEIIRTASEGEYYLNQANKFAKDNRQLDRNFLLMGIGASLKFGKNTELYQNFTQNYRSVTFSDIRTVNPSFIIDENIQDEKGWSADLGLRGKLGKILSYDVDVFSLYYGNRIGQVLNNRAQWVRKNIGTAFIYGLESIVQWDIAKSFISGETPWRWSAFSNLAYTKSEYLDSEESNVVGNSVEFIPLVNFKAGLNLGYQDVEVAVQFSYSDLQFTDVTNSPYNAENNKNVIGAIPSYHILDLSFSYKITEHIKVEAGLNNVLDEQYFTRRATGYPGPGIIPAEPANMYATLEYKF